MYISEDPVVSPHDLLQSYIVITPAKDESRFLERTIASMLQQTVLPKMWVIVDDGSNDRTLEIAQKYAHKYDWIVAMSVNRGKERRPGSHEIRAFYVGYDLVRHEEVGFVVKLDADLELPPRYFEEMLREFEGDPHLGIASGAYLEEHNGTIRLIKMPGYHAAGASKIVRRKCFLDIGGFPLSPGWDTADEIKARACGWTTKHFPKIRFMHLRPEGSAIGMLRTCADHGRMYYACGGGTWVLLLKAAHRLFLGRPRISGGIALLFGYLRAVISRQPKIVTKDEAKSYRKMLSEQVTQRIARRMFFWRPA